MKFSIISPIYNVEKYLQDAVNSVLSQSCSDYEMILVNDGSPDDSPAICDSLAKQYPQIKVIHKPNGGASDARNVGTDNAIGDYIIYLDSDDKWIDDDALRSMSDIIDSSAPDVLIFAVSDYDPASGKSRVSRGNYNQTLLNSLPPEKVIEALISTNNFPGAPWMLATKRDFIAENKIRFLKGVTAEDFDWIIKVLSNASSIKVLNRIVYQYRYTSEGSVTSKPRLSGILGIHHAISNWLSSHKKQIHPSITNYLSRIYIQALLNYAGLTKQDRIKAKQYIKQDMAILRQSSVPVFRVLHLILCVCGINPVSKLVRMARKIYV